jgi:type VI secretion system protein ImpE
MDHAHELLAVGDPRAALDALTREVRAHAADVKLRIFLFQLLCTLGAWDRASVQLDVCAELDAETLPMVTVYRDAVKSEALRTAVFAGEAQPLVFGPAQAWVAQLLDALHADAIGEPAVATDLRTAALDAAPETAGTLDGTAFAWIADADMRLGPVLEAVVDGRYAWVPFTAIGRLAIAAPTDLRDLVWARARLALRGGGERAVLLPVRYAGTVASGDAALQLARRTEWLSMGNGHYRGLGQRLFTTDTSEAGLLAIRDIVIAPPAGRLDPADVATDTDG